MSENSGGHERKQCAQKRKQPPPSQNARDATKSDEASLVHRGPAHFEQSFVSVGGSKPQKTEPAIEISQPSQRLKSDRWRAAFDNEGKLVGFQKVLKYIISGGVDHSIRPEVWEFLLGCYAAGTTSDYRKKTRQARRQRYKELIEQCQMMHLSIGTGTLAYTVGSKIMDARVTPRESARREGGVSGDNSRTYFEEGTLPATDVNGLHLDHDAQLPGAGEEVRDSFMKSAANQSPMASFTSMASPCLDNDASFYSDLSGAETDSNDVNVSGWPLKMLLERDCNNATLGYSPGRIGPNSPNILHTKFFQQSTTGDNSEVSDPFTRSWNKDYNNDTRRNFGKVKGNAAQMEHREITAGTMHRGVGHGLTAAISAGMPSPIPVSPQVAASEERMAEWLWTLHKIVVDVVRTDRHLKFYEDAKNLARMSDILAVYAWVDPATGYCQGMSDLLSPFVILFEDDADAFWCFESLLRRMRQNFQMEGPIGVIRQLEALPKIMELVDLHVFRHLVLIGADSFLFAFRMLLLHFRRELSFGEALCIWEMMWAADFEHATLWSLEYEYLEPLQIKPPSRSLQQRIREDDYMDYVSKISPYASPQPPSEHSFQQMMIGINYKSKSPLCGLRAGRFWPTFGRRRIRTVGLSFGRTGDSEISVFIVAAIILINRAKFLKDAQTMDDVIKMFNEIHLKIEVRRCIQTAMKLRTRYHQLLAKRAPAGQ